MRALGGANELPIQSLLTCREREIASLRSQ